MLVSLPLPWMWDPHTEHVSYTRRATRTIKATDQLLHKERDENETRRVRKHHHTHCSDTAPSATAGCMTDTVPDVPGGVIASL